jgi:hypothetical protein
MELVMFFAIQRVLRMERQTWVLFARMALTPPLNDYGALSMLKISLPVSAALAG